MTLEALMLAIHACMHEALRNNGHEYSEEEYQEMCARFVLAANKRGLVIVSKQAFYNRAKELGVKP